MRVGFDKNGKALYEGYICTFEIDDRECEGIIRYDEEVYGYVFDMLDNNFPSIIMSRVDYDTIKLQYTKDEVLDNDEVYAKWNSISI